jgi:hypothetical protein
VAWRVERSICTTTVRWISRRLAGDDSVET